MQRTQKPASRDCLFRRNNHLNSQQSIIEYQLPEDNEPLVINSRQDRHRTRKNSCQQSKFTIEQPQILGAQFSPKNGEANVKACS